MSWFNERVKEVSWGLNTMNPWILGHVGIITLFTWLAVCYESFYFITPVLQSLILVYISHIEYKEAHEDD